MTGDGIQFHYDMLHVYNVRGSNNFCKNYVKGTLFTEQSISYL